MKLVLLLALLAASECDSTKVKGQTGQDVTLSCKYDRKYYGALSVCWERGEIPSSGCSNQLISSDGDRVKTRASSRYELLGRLEDGDVSLTILNLTEGDAGRYGCRVEIPGWFNDEKHHFDLTVITAPRIYTSPASNTETPSEPTTAAQTEGGGQQPADRGCPLHAAGFVVSAQHRGNHHGEKTEATQQNPSAASGGRQLHPVQLHVVDSAAACSKHRCGQHLPDGRRWRRRCLRELPLSSEAPPTYLLNLEV